MTTSQPTTKVNPGSFKKNPKSSIKRIAYHAIRKIIKRDFRGSLNWMYVEVINYLNQRVNKKATHYCNFCEKKITNFVHNSNRLRISWNAICPQCSSRQRHRGLLIIYQKLLKELNNPSILHFAAEPIFYPLFKKYHYKTTDYYLTDVDFPQEDIQNLSFADETYDLILCNHVIEHVPDDGAALRELYRILRRKGCTLLSIPGNWKRLETILFGDLTYNGHYRDYGKDIIKKLEIIFDKVDAMDIYKYNNYYPLPLGLVEGHDLIFLCYKN